MLTKGVSGGELVVDLAESLNGCGCVECDNSFYGHSQRTSKGVVPGELFVDIGNRHREFCLAEKTAHPIQDLTAVAGVLEAHPEADQTGAPGH